MLRLTRAVVECLKSQPTQKMKARQIAEWIFATYPEECRAKLERSSSLKNEADLVQQLVAEIGAQRPQITKAHPQVRTTEGRPRLYYWSDASEEQQIAAVEPTPRQLHVAVSAPDASPLEYELYPKLAEFLRADSGLLVQRIDEKRSSNRRGPQGNRWLFPDLIALEDLTAEWTREVRECVSEAGARRVRLWSFEVKLLLNRSNVREAYFQTVSNSSWANFAYLAASEIEGSETMKELRVLSALHGVGLIRIDADVPADSEVLIPARERLEVDWANCDRLASENSDFKAVIRRLWEFHRTGIAKPVEWTA
jgi:uncharacterized protein